MRKFLLFLTALLMPVFALDMRADDEEAVTKIPLKMVSTGKNVRSLVPESIECHYLGMMNAVVTTVWSDLGEVVLTVTNCSTGNVWYDTFDSAQVPQTALTLSGEPAIYEIVYITETGGVYEGTFTIF